MASIMQSERLSDSFKEVSSCMLFKFKGLTFEDGTSHMFDLVRKMRQDCRNKFCDDGRYRDLMSAMDRLVNEVASVVCELFPCISDTEGTLNFQVQASKRDESSSNDESFSVQQPITMPSCVPPSDQSDSLQPCGPRTTSRAGSPEAAFQFTAIASDICASTKASPVQADAYCKPESSRNEVPGCVQNDVGGHGSGTGSSPGDAVGGVRLRSVNDVCSKQLANVIVPRAVALDTRIPRRPEIPSPTSPGFTLPPEPTTPLSGDGKPFRGMQPSQTPTTPSGQFVDLRLNWIHRPLPPLRSRSQSLVEAASTSDAYRQTLGRGSFGQVDMVECPKYAIADKKIDLLRTRTSLEDAIAEAEIMKKLQHPNIVGYFGCYQDVDLRAFHLLMELMPGGTVKDTIRARGPFRDKRVIVERMFDLLHGLAYLHANNIVHRDIKTDNLLIGESGELKIGDFGHARQMVDGVYANEGRIGFDGTIQYMAPEYVRLNKFTPACDVWSSGAVLFEMLTGRQLWTGEDMAVYYAIGMAQESPKVPDDLDILADLRDLVSRCLELDKDARPSARDLLHLPIFSGLVAPVCDLEKVSGSTPEQGTLIDVESASVCSATTSLSTILPENDAFPI